MKEMTEENKELRDGLVMLQKELMEIDTCKEEIFTKLFKAGSGPETEIPLDE